MADVKLQSIKRMLSLGLKGLWVFCVLMLSLLTYFIFLMMVGEVISFSASMAITFSPFVIYPLAYKCDIKFMYIHIFYFALLFVPGLFSYYVVISGSLFVEVCDGTDSWFILMAPVAALPIMFLMRSFSSVLAPQWHQSRKAETYLFAATFLLIPALSYSLIIGVVSYGCQAW